MNKENILVVVAMEVEAKILIDKFDNYEIKNKMGFTFYEGVINNKNIILLLSGVGVINASSGLSVAIMEYNPSIVINYGIGGAMSKDIHTKDIVIGNSVSNINSYRTSILGEGYGSSPNSWELLTFLSGETDRYIEYKTDKELLDIASDIEYNYGNVVVGKIGSGDAWNREVDRILYLNKTYGIIVEDMEAISIYNLCDKYNIPCISFKVISDNSLIVEEYDREVGIYLQEFICEYIDNIK